MNGLLLLLLFGILDPEGEAGAALEDGIEGAAVDEDVEVPLALLGEGVLLLALLKTRKRVA